MEAHRLFTKRFLKGEHAMQGFFKRLFDFSFQEFITPGIIKIIFWIVIILIALGVLVNIVTGFGQGAVYGIISLIVSIIVGFLLVIMARVYLELIMVFFRIMGLLEGMAKEKGVNNAAAAAAPAFTPPPAPEQ
jgi:hypothetical protein